MATYEIQPQGKSTRLTLISDDYKTSVSEDFVRASAEQFIRMFARAAGLPEPWKRG
jgi:hypothetical protein